MSTKPRIEFALKSFRLGYHSDEVDQGFEKMWSDLTCAQVLITDDTFHRNWSDLICAQEEQEVIPPPPPELFPYNRAWSDLVCAQTEAEDVSFNRAWSDLVCAQQEAEDDSFTINWSDLICAQTELIDDSFARSWSDLVCAQIQDLDETFQRAWSDLICAQESSSPPGIGTPEDPFLIQNYTHLKWLSDYSRIAKNRIIAEQTNDIDAVESQSEPNGFTPIKFFWGEYRGKGFVISNLYISDTLTKEPTGMFSIVGDTYESRVTDLKLLNVYVEGGVAVGGLIGQLYKGIVENCAVEGIVKGSNFVGGLVGLDFARNRISNCYTHVDVTRISTSNKSTFGGFIGYVGDGSFIYTSYSTGKVYSSEGVIWNEGAKNKGFTGSYGNARVTNCLFDSTSSEQTTDAFATAKTTAELQNIVTYTDQKFDLSIWNHVFDAGVNDNYLELRVFNEIAAPVAPDVPGKPDGEGTVGNPYKIATEDNLYWMTSNPDQWDKHFVQISNIGLGNLLETFGLLGWMPIGNTSSKFSGTYNGGGFGIKGLIINRAFGSNQGFFGVTSSIAEISEVKLLDPTIKAATNVGGIVGKNEGLVELSEVIGGTIEGTVGVGSICGLNDGTIQHVFSDASVKGTEDVGGLIGINEDEIIP